MLLRQQLGLTMEKSENLEVILDHYTSIHILIDFIKSIPHTNPKYVAAQNCLGAWDKARCKTEKLQFTEFFR